MALGIITGPLQARALGPSGRGELAAIVAVASMLPWIAGFGLDAFAGRQIARRVPVGEVMGSLGLMLVIVGLAIAPVGFPVAAALAKGRHVVHEFILIAFLMLPLSLLGFLSYYILNSLEAWNKTIVFRTVPTVTVAVVVVVLFVTGRTSVFALALATLLVGGVVSGLGVVWVLRRGRPRVRSELIKKAVPFGLKSWLALLATLTNGRLDQLLMISLTTSRQLGLYAVAVTMASFPNILVSALGQPLLSRVGAGEHQMVSRALRTAVLLIALANAALAALAPVLLPALFGSRFQGAVPMALVLLLAALPLSIVTTLSTAMTAAGRPGIPAVGEIIAVGITVPGLIVVLPILGGLGAALVSLVVYSVDAAYHLFFARKVFDARVSDLVVPRRQDYVWLRQRLVRAVRRLAMNMPVQS
jgi:O-antigen/teichoic acid export membrane protein